jgi:ethanolamine utilization protein EutN
MPGHKLIVAQPLGPAGRPDEYPLLVVDGHGAGVGSMVLITSDGKYAREVIQNNQTPVRYTTIGIEDEK